MPVDPQLVNISTDSIWTILGGIASIVFIVILFIIGMHRLARRKTHPNFVLNIFFESHGTTTDNEKHISSGWKDVELSDLGIRQAKELGERNKNSNFAVVYCSDLQRSYKTGEIAFFGRNIPIVHDARLNECNYGDLNGRPSSQVDPEKAKHVKVPFPNGESYEQTSKRMKAFLNDMWKKHQHQNILVIGHRATQYGLEHWIKGVPLAKVIIMPWKWQPGWKYEVGNDDWHKVHRFARFLGDWLHH